MNKWIEKNAPILATAGFILFISGFLYSSVQTPKAFRHGWMTRFNEYRSEIHKVELRIERMNAVLDKRIDLLMDLERLRAIGG